jgi:hypothetical protein
LSARSDADCKKASGALELETAEVDAEEPFGDEAATVLFYAFVASL